MRSMGNICCFISRIRNICLSLPPSLLPSLPEMGKSTLAFSTAALGLVEPRVDAAYHNNSGDGGLVEAPVPPGRSLLINQLDLKKGTLEGAGNEAQALTSRSEWRQSPFQKGFGWVTTVWGGPAVESSGRGLPAAL